MECTDLINRIEELKYRCQRNQTLTYSVFLSPLEQFEINYMRPLFCGGFAESERKIAVFLPDWCENSDFDQEDYLSAVKIQSYFGTPSHRDYLGAVLGLGIERNRIGDIYVSGDTAYLVCLRAVTQCIINDLEKVGRTAVKASEISIAELPVQERDIRELIFTVKSLRLDSICSEMFGISRSTASELIKEGLVALNYSECVKPDAHIHEGDTISLRGKGKGRLSEIGGRSRKDRTYVKAEIYK